MKLRLHWSVATAVAAVLALPGAASAAWLPSHTVNTDADSSHPPELAMAPAGTIGAAWRSTGNALGVTYQTPGQAADSDLIDLTGLQNAYGNDVAVNDAGDAIAVFDAQPSGGSYSRVYAVTRGAGDTAWSAPQAVSPQVSEHATSADVAIDADGNALVVWNAGYVGGSVKSVYRHADGTVEAPQEIRGAGDSSISGSNPAVALDGAGRATVAFANQSIKVATRSAGATGVYSAAEIVDTSPYSWVTEFSVRANAAGDAMVAWEHVPSHWARELRSIHRDALDADFGDVKIIGGDSGWGSGSVGMDATGDAVAVWFGGTDRTQGKTYDEATDTWTADPSVDSTIVANGLTMAVGPTGDAVTTWYESSGYVSSLKAMRRSSGAWSAPESVVGDRYSVYRPRVAVDDQGSAAALWLETEQSSQPYTMKLRVDDRGAPAAGTIDVPATVQLGEAADMSAAFTDRFSAVDVDWDFGDGETGTGSSVEHTYDELGEHTVTISATDAAGNATAPVTRTIEVVDTTDPETSISSAPTGTVNDDPVTVAFGGTDNSGGTLTFQCAVDGGQPETCSSPQDFAGLADGERTITVAAIDASGNRDETPASATFTVDHTAPDTTITDAPSGATSAAAPEVAFESDDAQATFECSIDGAAFEDCQSPLALEGLQDGSYDVAVRAVDAAGNADGTPAETTVVIDRTGPATMITSGPAENQRTNAQPVLFGFLADEAGDRGPECMIGTATVACSASSASIPGLTEGTHTFKVRSFDGLGNAGPWATRTFVVDRTAPSAAITAPASGSETSDTTPVLSGAGGRATGDDPMVFYGVWAGEDLMEEPVAHGEATVSPDGTWSVTLPALPLGTYTASVCQYDAAVNYQFPCPRVTFKVVAPPARTTTEQPQQTRQVPPVIPPTGTTGGGTEQPQPKVTVGEAVAQGATAYAGAFGKLGITGLLSRPVPPMPFQAPGPGKAQIDLLAPTAKASAAAAKRKQAKPVVVATGSKTITAAGTTQIRVKLTAKGRKLLKKSRSIRLTLKTSFTPKGGKVASVSRKVTLKKK